MAARNRSMGVRKGYSRRNPVSRGESRSRARATASTAVRNGISPTADSDEQTTLSAQRPGPADLRQPGFDAPVIDGRREEIVRLVAEHGAGIRAEIVHVILTEPPLRLGESVRVFFGVRVLIAQPRLPSRRVVLPLAEDWIEWHDA
jgi:hypothetical protein